jgi:hypothetical protein
MPDFPDKSGFQMVTLERFDHSFSGCNSSAPEIKWLQYLNVLFSDVHCTKQFKNGCEWP